MKALYKATGKGTIEIKAPELDLEIHQMIVWLMHDPDAKLLLPAYREIRANQDAEQSGFAKNVGIEL